MAASLRTRKKSSSAQLTVQDLALLLGKTVGIDLTQEYDSDAFSSMAVDMYQSTDSDVYTEQGAYIYNLLQQLCVTTQQETAIVKTERRTKVWYQHNLQVANLDDTELVNSLLVYPTTIKTVFDAEGENLSFLAITINDD